MCDHIDLQTLAGSAFDNCVTFTFDLLTLGSLHAVQLPCTVCLPSLLLIAQAIFLLYCGHTDRVTDATDNPTHALVTASIGNQLQ